MVGSSFFEDCESFLQDLSSDTQIIGIQGGNNTIFTRPSPIQIRSETVIDE
jgi:hypothetical protein